MKRTTIIIFITSMICFTACGANSFSDSKAETENLESVREMIEQKEAEQAAQRKTADIRSMAAPTEITAASRIKSHIILGANIYISTALATIASRP